MVWTLPLPLEVASELTRLPISVAEQQGPPEGGPCSIRRTRRERGLRSRRPQDYLQQAQPQVHVAPGQRGPQVHVVHAHAILLQLQVLLSVALMET